MLNRFPWGWWHCLHFVHLCLQLPKKYVTSWFPVSLWFCNVFLTSWGETPGVQSFWKADWVCFLLKEERKTRTLVPWIMRLHGYFNNDHTRFIIHLTNQTSLSVAKMSMCLRRWTRVRGVSVQMALDNWNRRMQYGRLWYLRCINLRSELAHMWVNA